ncbi:hypothetical protein GCM10027037_17390 [Mucilaginibacter koreensis]
MNRNRLVPGLILVFIGLAFLLNRLGVLHFHWQNFMYLWPLFLVIGGVNLLLSHNRAPWATAVRVVVAVFCLGLIFFGDFGNRYERGGWFRYNYHNDDDSDDNDNDNDTRRGIKGSTNTYSQPWEPKVKVASLSIQGAATSYTLNDTTSELMSAQTHEYNGRYVFNQRLTDSTAVINLHMKGKNWNFGSDNSNSAAVKLNSRPLWDIDIKGGADELKFDLSKFKIRNLKLSGGATDYTIKMGMPLAETHVNISTGVSDINISVPTGAACQVITSSGLSDTNINGFNKVGNNRYETANFSSAPNKMYIHFSGGISDFNVNRY